MDLWNAFKVIARRWPIVVASMLVTAVGANIAVARVKPDYEAKGTVVLLAPSTVVEQGGVVDVNPYTRFGAERVVASALVSVMRGPQFEQRVEQVVAEPEFEVNLDPQGSGAIISVVAKARDGAAALRTLDTVIELLKRELADRQRAAGAPPDTWITADVLTLSDRPTQLLGSRLRVLIAVVALGVGIAITLAFVVESLAQRPRRQPSSEALAERAVPLTDVSSATPHDGRTASARGTAASGSRRR